MPNAKCRRYEVGKTQNTANCSQSCVSVLICFSLYMKNKLGDLFTICYLYTLAASSSGHFHLLVGSRAMHLLLHMQLRLSRRESSTAIVHEIIMYSLTGTSLVTTGSTKLSALLRFGAVCVCV